MEYVDIFEINHKVMFYKHEYPEIDIKVKYNPMGLYLNITIRSGMLKLNHTEPALSTEHALAILDLAMIDFLTVWRKGE